MQVVADRQRGLVEAGLEGGRREHRFADRRVVLVVEEALHVVGRHGHVVGLRYRCRARLVGTVAAHLRGAFRIQRVAAEAVIQRADHIEHLAAGGQIQPLGADAGTADRDHFGIGIPARHAGRRAGRQRVGQLHARLAVGARHAGDHGMEDAIAGRRGVGLVDAAAGGGIDGEAGGGHTHAFQRFELIEGTVGVGEVRAQRHRHRQRVAGGIGQHGQAAADLGERWLGGVGGGHVFDHRALHAHPVADGGRLRRWAAGVDVHAFGGGRVGVGFAIGCLQEEPGAAACRHDARGGHHLALQRRARTLALDGVDRQQTEVVVEDGAGGAQRGRQRAGEAADLQPEAFIRLRRGVAQDIDGNGGAAFASGDAQAGGGQGDIVAAGGGGAIDGGGGEAHPARTGRLAQAQGEYQAAGAGIAFGLADIGQRGDRLAAAAAQARGAGGIARGRRAGGEVGGVVVGIGATVVAAQHRQRVAGGRRGRIAFGAAGRAAIADQIGIAGGAGAAQRGGAIAQRHLAGGAAHGQRADGIGRGQRHAAAAAVGLLDQVIAAGRDSARQRGDLPAAAGRGGVLHRPAIQADRGTADVVQLDEIAAEGGAAIAATAVDLADDDLGIGVAGHGQRTQKYGCTTLQHMHEMRVP